MPGLRCLAVSCAWLLFAAPALASTPSRAKPATTPKAAQARDQAQLAFQRDLVSVLALRADPIPLLGAALLARPLFNQPPGSSFHALIERAAAADGAGPAISWARLADCDAKADNCPNTGALDTLLQQAPDNAAAWLVKLGVDARERKQDDAREDLRRAAAATRYDDYTGTSLKTLDDVVGALPPPAGALDPAHGAGAVGMQTVLLFGLASTQPQPSLQLVAKLCENAGEDDSIRADCLSLAKLLQWGSSPLARSLGLHLAEVLADDPAAAQAARDARRSLVWQVRNFNQLLAQVQDDAALAHRLLSLARNGGTEMSLQLAALRGAGIAAEPPADWEPAQGERGQ